MEQVLHYVWKHKLFRKELRTTEGVPIEILDVGLHNTDEGPDFFNAKIKVGDRMWVGNVEIHHASSDWVKHEHHKNKVYNSVILHIVEKADTKIYNESKLRVPQCEIEYPKEINQNIEFLLNSDVTIPCCNYLKSIEGIHLNSWLNSLLLERLERKSLGIERLLNEFNNSWAEAFYVLLSRSMGFGLNSDAFEALALNIPLIYILKQADNLFQVEAMLFGQAGFLEDAGMKDEYFLKMKKEYDFLKNKYSLSSLDRSRFRLLRTRPASSPYIRIAQLAVLVQNIQGLYAKIVNSKDVGQVRLLLQVKASEYWDTHYSFGEESPRKQKYIGDSSLDVMIINTVVPILFLLGRKTANESYEEKAFSFLEIIKAESNSIIKQFASFGVQAENAYISQALIQLKREYCEKKKCLFCRIGFRFLSKTKT